VPDIRTIVSDLFHNRARRVLGMGTLGAQGPQLVATLSDFYRVTEAATAISTTVGGPPDNSISVVAAPLNGNGFGLFFQEDWSTVATLTRTHRTVLGGGYSGCLYSVYFAGAGVYKCVHTARPNGATSDAFVAGIRGYAADRGWRLVHEIRTVTDEFDGGAGVGGCVTTFFVTRVSYTIAPTPIVRTVRLRQDAQGYSVSRRRWNTATP
jgi:hypothetical protein